MPRRPRPPPDPPGRAAARAAGKVGEELGFQASIGRPDGESFTTRTVEATYLCSRGVTADGSCV